MASIHDLQNEQADRDKKAHRVVAINSSGQAVALATEEKQDDIITELQELKDVEWRYKGVNKTADTDYKYFGFKEKGGEHWYIMRFTIADKAEVLYADGDDNFDTVWNDPSLLTYS